MSNENDLIGLNNISQMYYNKGVYYDTLQDFDNMEKAFLDAVNFDHIQAMNRLGLYYDDIAEKEKMLKYYLLAIDLGETSAMYNLARYYSDHREYDNMIKYYLMAIALKDTDCCYELSIYYQSIKDFDNMKKYYIMATEIEIELGGTKRNNVNDGFNDFNPFQLLEMLQSIENPNNNIVLKIEKFSKNKENSVYLNKIRLFTKLNHIEECAICYETKLHIDIYCGHTFCIDCYPSLFNKSCPFCRISRNSCAFT
jgi:hypothetical protein